MEVRGNLGDFREGINAGKRKDQGESEWTKNRKGEKRGGDRRCRSCVNRLLVNTFVDDCCSLFLTNSLLCKSVHV